jgi:hypothetical protein
VARICRSGLPALAFIALSFATAPADAAIVVDSATSAQIPSTSPNPFTFAHTTSGSDRLLLVSIASQPNDDDGIIEVVTGITYGGQALTVVGTAAQGPDNSRIEIWRLVNPPTGSNTRCKCGRSEFYRGTPGHAAGHFRIGGFQRFIGADCQR